MDPYPQENDPIYYKCVFKTKLKSNVQLDKYNARLIDKGYNYIEGIDFFETFSPIIKPQTIRLVPSLAMSLGWSLKKLDMNNQILNGDLKETIFRK